MSSLTITDLLVEHHRFGRVAAPGAAVDKLIPAVSALQAENDELRRALTEASASLQIALAHAAGSDPRPMPDACVGLERCGATLERARTLAARH